MKKAKCVFLIGLILFLNLLSLNSSFSSQSTNPLKSTSDSTDDPLIVGTTSLGYELDPVIAGDRASLDIIDQVWEGLYAHNLDDPRMRIVPRLAADCGSWNEKGTVFNVTLRSGITFHNGEAFTAADVNYTFSRLWQLCVFLVKDSSYSHALRDLREIYFPNGFNTTKMNASVGYGYIINQTVIVDDLHVSFELNFPYAPFQSLLCFSGSYIVDKSTTNIDSILTFANINNNTAIGAGPYKLTERTTEYCKFEYWEEYYRGIPAIKKITFIKDISTISQALLDGDIDLPRGHFYNSDFTDDFEEAKNIYIGPYREESIISIIHMNNMKIDRSFRHAINYAIDYDKIINEIYSGQATRMTSIVPPGIPYHKECDVPIFNITKARQILIEAGYTESYGLDVNSTDDDWKDVAESYDPIFKLDYKYTVGNINKQNVGLLIRDNLKEIGICVDMVGDVYGFFITSIDSLGGSIDNNYMLLRGWMPDYNDPSQIINALLSNTSSLNFAQVNDPWLQQAMEEALKIIDEDVRRELYYDIQDYIATDLMPYVFIKNYVDRTVRANYVITQPNSMNKFYVFPFSWHGVNTTFNDPYLELWCNTGSPPVLEFWPEPREHISGYPILLVSIFSLVLFTCGFKRIRKS